MSDDETYYAKCRACGWRKEFTRGSMRSDTPLDESAKKRLAGHRGHCEAADGDDYWETVEYGPIADEFADVLEVKATVDVTFHLPMDTDSPFQTIADLGEFGGPIRHIDGIDIDEIYPIERY